jgi:hypothetical protein
MVECKIQTTQLLHVTSIFLRSQKSHLQAIRSGPYKSVGSRSKTKKTKKQGKELGRTKGKSFGFCVLILQNNLSFRSGCFSSRRS